ncbi:helix-turn-helix domain-containing protein [Paenibacillus filicis]|uniref:Helix-turn-helix domain-containing protein n=1 Tax=Paenibacillus filicis TaxID=669464 RepID=A0ABU9DGF6_9BACL
MPIPPPTDRDDKDTPLFQFLDISELGDGTDELTRPAFIETYTLLLLTGGRGSLTADGQVHTMEPDKCLLLSPGMLVEADEYEPLEGYQLRFEALRQQGQTGGERIFQAAGNVFDCGVDIPKAWFRELHHLALPLMESCKLPAEQRRHRDQLFFYKLVYQLTDIVPEQGDPDSWSAIRRTIQAMESRYGEPLSRDELAGIAGMSPWHYSHLFKSMTGLSPHRYLADIRLRRAKELLRRGLGPRDVAIQVGFGDDSHFRRKFRESVGLSPSAFASRKPEKVATVSYHYAAHLLALGIVPYAAPVHREREQHRSDYHDLIQVHMLRRKRMPAELWRSNIQSLARAKPEMIVCDELLTSEIDEQLRKIAPIAVVPWMGDRWRGHFRQIAAIVGKQKEVEHWIAEYDRRADEAGTAIRRCIGEQTVALMHIMLGELLVYGKRNGGAVLFEDLRLRPAYETDSISVFRVLPRAELVRFDADYVLIVVDQDPASLMAWEKLQQEDAWMAVQAVRNGRVKLIPEAPWLEYSPFAHDLVLEEARRLFAGDC